jgi:hypothetical protein
MNCSKRLASCSKWVFVHRHTTLWHGKWGGTLSAGNGQGRSKSSRSRAFSSSHWVERAEAFPIRCGGDGFLRRRCSEHVDPAGACLTQRRGPVRSCCWAHRAASCNLFRRHRSAACVTDDSTIMQSTWLRFSVDLTSGTVFSQRQVFDLYNAIVGFCRRCGNLQRCNLLQFHGMQVIVLASSALT